MENPDRKITFPQSTEVEGEANHLTPWNNLITETSEALCVMRHQADSISKNNSFFYVY